MVVKRVTYKILKPVHIGSRLIVERLTVRNNLWDEIAERVNVLRRKHGSLIEVMDVKDA
jgi:hypothetical protein